MSKALLVILAVIFAIFLFVNFSNTYLWEDEAETATLGQNTLMFGYPLAWDGKNLITQEAGNDSNTARVWVHQSWLPFYISAFSQKVFGKNNFGARFVFIVFGFFSFFLFYELSKIIFKDTYHQLFAVFLFTTSIPLILHLRQGRYYSLALFSSLWLLYSYLDFIKKSLNKTNKKLDLFTIFNFSSASIILFHSHYFVFLYFFTGILIHQILFFRKNPANYSILFSFIPVFCLTFPWFLYTRAWEKGGQYSISKFFASLLKSSLEINIIFPLVFLILLIPIYIHKRKNIAETKKALLWPLLFGIFFISISPLIPSVHYFLPLIPILIIFSAVFFINLFEKNKIIALVILMTFIFTNFLSIFPLYFAGANKLLPKPTSNFYLKKSFYLKDFIYELTHDYDGPVEGITKYLKANASPNDTVFISYGAESIIFYNNLKIIRAIPFITQPNWIIIRNEEERGGDFKWVLEKSLLTPDLPKEKWNIEQGPVKEINYRYVMDYIKKNNYKAITINYPDLLWENGPHPLYHKFKTEKNCPNVVIYKWYTKKSNNNTEGTSY